MQGSRLKIHPRVCQQRGGACSITEELFQKFTRTRAQIEMQVAAWLFGEVLGGVPLVQGSGDGQDGAAVAGAAVT